MDKSAEYIFSHTSSRTKLINYYKNSGHLICHDTDNKKLFEDIEEFIREITK
ncbi:MAG: hypothetical protein GX660_28505 [Clostridiaceae bacterium]|nr:hypothetical protein [Clostridiaceae bacterium]